MSDPLKPSAGVLVKLGSIVVHLEEARSKDVHEFDLHALKSLLSDTEIIRWLKAMDKMALLPKKR